MALAIDVRELNFEEIESVSGGDCVREDREKSLADDVRDIADFVKGLIKGFMD